MLFKRFAENPLVTTADVVPSMDGFEVIGAFNAGVAERDGEVLMLLRVAERPPQVEGFVSYPVMEAGAVNVHRLPLSDPAVDVRDPRVICHKGVVYLTSISHLRLARSRDGRSFTVDEAPTLLAEEPYEEFGIEDPRVTLIDGAYYINYSAIARTGITTVLRRTRDWRCFDRLGVVFPPDNKDVAVFPGMAGGLYWAFHRPCSGFGQLPRTWLASSPDLVNWGGHTCLLSPRPGMWDGLRIGCGSPPIRTEAGWLSLYHGADESQRYSMGGVLLDLSDPRRVVARSDEPLLAPEAPYETEGFFGGVCFACGHLLRADGSVWLYYGAADTVMAGAAAPLSGILASLGV